jgi:xanthine dehydrogenase YagS FAD-binding subunit
VLQGGPANPATIANAAQQAIAGAKPLPMTGYKLDLLRGVVHDLLERLVA